MEKFFSPTYVPQCLPGSWLTDIPHSTFRKKKTFLIVFTWLAFSYRLEWKHQTLYVCFLIHSVEIEEEKYSQFFAEITGNVSPNIYI